MMLVYPVCPGTSAIYCVDYYCLLLSLPGYNYKLVIGCSIYTGYSPLTAPLCSTDNYLMYTLYTCYHQGLPLQDGMFVDAKPYLWEFPSSEFWWTMSKKRFITKQCFIIPIHLKDPTTISVSESTSFTSTW